jgi:hypothetical protein
MTFDGTNLQLNNQADLRFGDTSTNFVALQAPATVTTNTIFTLPVADGSNGQFLATNGSTNLTFISLTGGLIASVASTSDSNMLSTTNATYTSFSTLKLSVTPQGASNKVLLLLTAQNVETGGSGKITFFRGSTDVNAGEPLNIGVSDGTMRYFTQYLDSPSTTSSTEYTVRALAGSGTLKLNNSAQGEGVLVFSAWEVSN